MESQDQSPRPFSPKPEQDEIAFTEMTPTDAPQYAAPRSELTWQALLTGMLLGAVLSGCNIYIGLKLGTAFGMSIVAALTGFGFWSGLRVLTGGRLRQWSILENNINQTACSSGAYVASAGLVAPIPALTMMTGRTLDWPYLALWLFSVMLVGIAAAVPLRRQMIVHEKIRFPAGVASAEMLRELHATGAEAVSRVWGLIFAGLVATVLKLVVTVLGKRGVSFIWSPPISISSIPASSLKILLTPSLLLPGIGALIGIRACASLLVGAILAWAILPPHLLDAQYVRHTSVQTLEAIPTSLESPTDDVDDIRNDENLGVLGWTGVMSDKSRDALLSHHDDAAYKKAVRQLCGRSRNVYKPLSEWLLWPGVTMMVVASLVSLCFAWRSILRSLPWRRGSLEPVKGDLAVDEFPSRWYYPGLLIAMTLSVVLQVHLFDIPWWAAIIAVLMAFVAAVVAARISGETGLSASSAIGKVTQFFFAALTPRNPVPNLMAANVTGGAAIQCADLLDDLKCGHMLGASPRRQVVAQICGAFAGALAGAAIYLILVPNPAEMPITDVWPAPAAVVWKSVAELFADGFGALPRGVPFAAALAAFAAAAMTIIERVGPEKLRPYMLSPLSVGLAFILPPYLALSLFIGGLFAWILGRWFKSWTARFLIVTCTGLIVGESLTDICITFVDYLL